MSIQRNSPLERALGAAAAILLGACGGGGSGGVMQPSAQPALAVAQAFVTNRDALTATAIPATGASFLADHDGCWLNDGASKAFAVGQFDADPHSVARLQFWVGAMSTQVKVVADRSSTNADGSHRREIDIQYQVNYRDGTVIERSGLTLISGSSMGAVLPDGSACTAVENRPEWRSYGNRAKVGAQLVSVNERIFHASLANGLSLSPAVTYSRYIDLGLRDPAKVATYAIVKGPGLVDLTVSLGGVATQVPKPLKLISPRLLRDAPELAGKPGHFVDAKDTDSFNICRTPTGSLAAAHTADCTMNGATSNNWGAFGASDLTALDRTFDALGVLAGGPYTFDIYNDDGWKTVNGQLGKTPIATYTRTLRSLPYSALAMSTHPGGIAGAFPTVTSSSRPQSDVATAIRTQQPMAVNFFWSAPGTMPDARLLALTELVTFVVGRANPTGARYPAGSKTERAYLAPSATSGTIQFPVPDPVVVESTFGEFGMHYSNRNGNLVRTRYVFQ